MAITAALLTSSTDATDLSTYVTASITPTANRLVLAAVMSEGTAAEEIPAVTGNGLTWVEVLSIADAGPTNRLTVFRALGASPTAGAVTFAFGATQTRCAWSIVEFASVDTSGTNGSGAVVQSKSATGMATAANADFDAAFGDAVNNATYSANVHRNANDTLVEGSFTELSDVNVETVSLQVMWLLGEEQTPAPSWTTSALFNQVIIEVKAGSAADQNLTGALFASTATFPTGALTQSSATTVTASGTTVTITTAGTVTIRDSANNIVYSGGSATITLPSGSYTWTSTDSGSGAFTVGGGGNRMGGSGAIRKPPRNVGR